MDYSGKRDLEEADLYFYKNDSRCIEIYARNNSNMARCKLALIYLEGKCGQNKDITKALSYVKNNTNYAARALEAQIRIFEIGCSYSEMQSYLLELIDIHEQMPAHTWVNRVLSNMYLQGKVVSTDFAKAVDINPKLLDQKVFNKAVSNMSVDIRRNLFDHILSQNNDDWRILVDDFKKEYANVFHKNRIKSCISKKQWEDAADDAIKWFSFDESVESAYYVLRYALNRLSNEEYIRASDILETAAITHRNISCIIESARLHEDWHRVEKWLSSEFTDEPRYYYERGYLEKHRGNNAEALKYFIKSLYKDPKTGEYTNKSCDAICEVFRLEPGLVIWRSEYADLLLSKRDSKYTYVVAKAYCKCGDKHHKNQGVNLLRQISERCYFAAALLYEITGEQHYAGMAKKLEFSGKRLNDYFFDNKDSTDVIEARYRGLSPYYAIRALDVLAVRYLQGKKNTPIDYQKAKLFLSEEIDLCKKYHVTTKYADAKIGLMMVEGKIECLDDRAMFESIYQLKDQPAYTCAVARCLIKGIGTDRDIDEAVCLLSSSSSPHILRELLNLSKAGEIGTLNESVILDVLRQILCTTVPNPDEIELLRSISPDTANQSDEIPYSRYQRTKARALRAMAESKKDDFEDAIRYWDFARKCGDNTGAVKVAMIALNMRNERLAYSILKTSDVDPQDKLYMRISAENHILVNVDEELAKLMSSSERMIHRVVTI